MLLVSILVFLGFIILTLILRVVLGLSLPNLSFPKRQFHARRFLFYGILVSYFLVFMGSFFWMLYELLGKMVIQNLRIPIRPLVLSLISAIIIFIAMAIFAAKINPYLHLMRKYPRPDVEASSPALLEWQKIYKEALKQKENYLADHIGRYIFWYFVIIFVATLLVALSTILIAVFVH